MSTSSDVMSVSAKPFYCSSEIEANTIKYLIWNVETMSALRPDYIFECIKIFRILFILCLDTFYGVPATKELSWIDFIIRHR